MMPVVLVSPSGTGASKPTVMDFHQSPPNIGLSIQFPAGSAGTCKAQYTYDDPFAAYVTDWNTNAVWQDHPILTGITANSSDYIATPVRGIRLNTTAYTSGNPILIIVQAGTMSG